MHKLEKNMMKHFEKNPRFNSYVHVLAGVGIGFLLAYPVAGAHPVRWGLVFLVLSILGHWWAATR